MFFKNSEHQPVDQKSNSSFENASEIQLTRKRVRTTQYRRIKSVKYNSNSICLFYIMSSQSKNCIITHFKKQKSCFHFILNCMIIEIEKFISFWRVCVLYLKGRNFGRFCVQAQKSPIILLAKFFFGSAKINSHQIILKRFFAK